MAGNGEPVRMVAPMDAMYLWGEVALSPCHVVALQIYRPPAGAGPELLDELYARMTDPATVEPAFRRRPVRSLATGWQFAWAEDDEVDLSLHVRRVGLPAPGRIRELLAHLGDFHAVPLPRDRPLWEAQVVEGLTDGRFAVLTKMHHALFDGVNMGRHLLGGLSPDPANRTGTAPWIESVAARERRRTRSPRAVPSPGDRVRAIVGAVRDVAASVPALVGAGVAAARDAEVALPFTAPPTMFNGPVGSGRRFAGDTWPTARLRDVARRTGVTSNDVAIAMCAGALRAYLGEQDALPEDPLVAMVPVALETTDPSGAPREGNAWAAVLCGLATDTDDPAQRLVRIHDSMTRSKDLMSTLDPVSAGAVSAATMAGAAPVSVPGVPRMPRPVFNLIISSIPATTVPLYLDGCELTDAYPASMVLDGQALNITIVSYVDELAFGITGCRRSVPSLQRLLVHLETALADLETATAEL